LARQLDTSVHHLGQRDVGRYQARLRHQKTQNRPEARITVRAVSENNVALQRCVAAERLDRRRIVVAHTMVHAAHNGQPVRHTRQAWQMLADAQPWHAGRNGLELASQFARRIGLHVPCVQVARPAGLEQQNARFNGRGGRADSSAVGLCRFSPKQIGQIQSQEPQAADSQQFPARKASRGEV
jgi:hypothetical protein